MMSIAYMKFYCDKICPKEDKSTENKNYKRVKWIIGNNVYNST